MNEQMNEFIYSCIYSGVPVCFKVNKSYFLIDNYLSINQVKDPLAKEICSAQVSLK